jgi:hypothetical protein
MAAENPIQPPYNYPATTYHGTNPALYNRTVLATSPFIATGSNAFSIGFYVSASTAVTVTLVNGGQFSTTPSATNPDMIYPMSVASVDAGTVYLLYR